MTFFFLGGGGYNPLTPSPHSLGYATGYSMRAVCSHQDGRYDSAQEAGNDFISPSYTHYMVLHIPNRLFRSALRILGTLLLVTCGNVR